MPLSPDLRAAAASVRGSFGADAAAFRWVAPENLHLTLRFLGEIDERRVGRVVEAARDAALGASPFPLRLAGVGGFPSLRSPRVLWVGITGGADRLTALARSLEAALRARKFPREPRSFRPHLTVARAKSGGRPAGPARLADHLSDNSPVIGTQTVERLAVIESILRRDGPLYREVAAAQLGEPCSVGQPAPGSDDDDGVIRGARLS